MVSRLAIRTTKRFCILLSDQFKKSIFTMYVEFKKVKINLDCPGNFNLFS